MSKHLSLCKAATLGAVFIGLGSPALAEVAFDWATVGNPGNAVDPEDGDIFVGGVQHFGSVPNVFRMSKHEVTNDQYAEFLNAVAATDTNGLYSTQMGSDARSGIRLGGECGATYCVKANMGNKPVNYVSFFDAMRFVNWLHNGQPNGVQDANTTENGVYTISDGLSEIRAVDAKFFIPTENEWYKAAYHQPSTNGGDSDDYWLYATATNTTPNSAMANATGDISNPGTNVVNWVSRTDWNGVTNGNVTTVGSAGPQSESFYGTSDQAGNVSEWNETVVFELNRGIRGASYRNNDDALESSMRGRSSPESEGNTHGFRVASPAICHADLDCDGDVDLIDFGLLQGEFTGPK